MNTYSLRLNKELHPVITIPNFLSDFEINRIFDLVKDKKSLNGIVGASEEINDNTLNKTTKEQISKKYRESNIKWICLDKYSNWLYEKIIKCINRVNAENYGYILKFIEDLQFSEYSSQKKGFYIKHIDCGNPHGMKTFVDIRKLSFSIQLSNPKEYEGGQLILETSKNDYFSDHKDIVASKEKGTIIFFPSHIVHEVTPVTKGVRYSLVGWINGPNLI